MLTTAVVNASNIYRFRLYFVESLPNTTHFFSSLHPSTIMGALYWTRLWWVCKGWSCNVDFVVLLPRRRLLRAKYVRTCKILGSKLKPSMIEGILKSSNSKPLALVQCCIGAISGQSSSSKLPKSPQQTNTYFWSVLRYQNDKLQAFL